MAAGEPLTREETSTSASQSMAPQILLLLEAGDVGIRQLEGSRPGRTQEWEGDAPLRRRSRPGVELLAQSTADQILEGYTALYSSDFGSPQQLVGEVESRSHEDIFPH